MVELSGQCACGAVHYRGAAAMLRRTYCDCAICSAGWGEPVVVGVEISRSSLAWTAAAPLSYRSGERARHAVCGCCGTLLGTWHADGSIRLEAATVDESVHVGVRCHVRAWHPRPAEPLLPAHC